MPWTARWTMRNFSSGRDLNAVSVALASRRISFEPEMMLPMLWTSCLLPGSSGNVTASRSKKSAAVLSLGVLPAASGVNCATHGDKTHRQRFYRSRLPQKVEHGRGWGISHDVGFKDEPAG